MNEEKEKPATVSGSDFQNTVKIQLDISGIEEAQAKADKLLATLKEIQMLITTKKILLPNTLSEMSDSANILSKIALILAVIALIVECIQ